MKLEKLIAGITSAVILCSLNVFTWVNNSLIANAESYSDGMDYGDYLSYQQIDADDDGTYDYVEISDCDESATEIVIPSEIDGLPVTEIFYYALYDCTNLTSIEIPDSVTSIEDISFGGCTSLVSINVSEENENYSSFYGILYNKDKTEIVVVPKGIKECVIPNGVTEIRDITFSECTNLTSIEIPDSVTSIDYNAFYYGCTSLESINVSTDNENYSSIDGVLFNKDKTELIQYPIGKQDIEYSIPNGVTKMRDNAICDCINLASIEIPDSLTEITTFYRIELFSGCTSLTNINVSENNENYSSIDGVLFNKNETELIKYPLGKENLKYVIPNGVTVLGGHAFGGCTSLESVEIPDSVIEIYYTTFDNDTSLTNINVSEENDTSLTNINVSEENEYYSSIDGVLFNKGNL